MTKHPLTNEICDQTQDSFRYMTIQEKKILLNKLKTAYKTCFDCGHKYGVYSVGCSSVYESKCEVCGETKKITETRDFAYFITGISKLKKELACLEKNN